MTYSMSMDLGPRQSLKQNQLLMMLPQMRQAISLLQLPIMELSPLIEAELEHNPVLEYLEERTDDGELERVEEDAVHEEPEAEFNEEKEITIDNKDFEVLKQLDEDFRDYYDENQQEVTPRTRDDEKKQTFLESSLIDTPKLFEFLMLQAEETFENAEDRKVAECIIGNLDERGFLQMPLEEISLLAGAPAEKVKTILIEIQTFEPYGIGASDLRESLLIQLRCLHKQNTLAYIIIEDHFDDLLHNRLPNIQKKLNCDYKKLCETIENQIARLDFRPGATLSASNQQNIVADLTIVLEDTTLIVEVNRDSIPSLCLNRRYMRMLEDESLPVETKDYIKQNVLSAKWLMRNIYQRNDTLIRIGEMLAKVQREFLINPEGKLVPLTMKTVAQDLDLHESTIARAVSNKYVNTPRGLLPLRSFFSTAYVNTEGEDISSTTVQDAIQNLIEKEDKKRPLSDDTISKKLKDVGIICARRTVAKHRQELNLGNTSQRRKFH